MLERLRLKLNNRIVALVGVFGVGLLPCPDCGVPLAVHVWPAAGVVWLWRRWRRRSSERLEFLLTDDLAPGDPPARSGTSKVSDDPAAR